MYSTSCLSELRFGFIFISAFTETFHGSVMQQKQANGERAGRAVGAGS